MIQLWGPPTPAKGKNAKQIKAKQQNAAAAKATPAKMTASDDTRITALALPQGTLSPAMDAYFAKCTEKLGFVPNVLQAYAFDNAKLEPGETILVQAGGSGIGTAAIKMAKAVGCTVITTVGDDEKAAKAKALGADHVINYRKDRFSTITRKLTNKKGVDVVFEHVGGEGFNESLLVLKRGGRLVTCGSTAGPSITFNLMQLFQQQYKIFGSFGASIRNIAESLDKMATGMLPVIDTEMPLDDVGAALKRMESRQVFGKIIVRF